MRPTVWIYGGVHYDPGSRLKFLQEMAKQEKSPHFVAVEWEKSVFEAFVAWRPWVKEHVCRCWDFLSPEDCDELSLALAWEGDAHLEVFPGTDRLWLENGFQQEHFKQRYGRDPDKFPETFAQGLVERICHPCQPTMKEWISNADPVPEPRSRDELIDRVWRKVWAEANGEPEGSDRDARWASGICERSSGLDGGWIAVVVGWKHAKPKGDDRALRSLLVSMGFEVHSVYLGPEA